MIITYRASHILISDLEDAQYILDKLASGIKFESLAKEFSECDSSSKGGYLGQFSQGTMDAVFERSLSKMKTGEISSPVKTKYGFHIIKKLELN